MSTPDHLERLKRIVARLVEQSDANAVIWERATAFLEGTGWAVDVLPYRFRIHSEGDESPVYILELVGQPALTPDTIRTGADDEWNRLLEQLFRAARENAARNTPDPLDDVEARLGLVPPPRNGAS
jgi:hypothetical protein